MHPILVLIILIFFLIIIVKLMKIEDKIIDMEDKIIADVKDFFRGDKNVGD